MRRRRWSSAAREPCHRSWRGWCSAETADADALAVPGNEQLRDLWLRGQGQTAASASSLAIAESSAYGNGVASVVKTDWPNGRARYMRGHPSCAGCPPDPARLALFVGAPGGVNSECMPMLEQLGSHALPRTSQGPSTDLVVGPNAGRAISALEAVASAGGNDITQHNYAM